MAVAQHSDTAFLSSGTNLIDLMKVGVARPARLVDITCLTPDAVPSGSWGGRYLSLGDYVTRTGPRTGRPPPEGVYVAYPPYPELGGRERDCIDEILRDLLG